MNLDAYVELKAALLALGIGMALLLVIAGSLPAALLWLVCAWLGPEVWLSRSGRLVGRVYVWQRAGTRGEGKPPE